MSARILRRSAATLLLLLAACSGGKDATGPGGDPGTGQISGDYVLANINQNNPGQIVTLANPNGTVIEGQFRFDPRSQLHLGADGSWTLFIQYDKNGEGKTLGDEGTYTPDNAAPGALLLHSDKFDDDFIGQVQNEAAGIRYDFDGDGQLETVFVFGRLGSSTRD
jgi:hypothetical protein